MPDRSVFSRVLKALEGHIDLVSKVLDSMSRLLQERPWRKTGPVGGERGEGGSKSKKWARKERRYGLERFMADFKDDRDVEAWFLKWRWPGGVSRPKCGNAEIVLRKNRLP